MNFLIQKINGQIVHDFAFSLVKSEKFSSLLEGFKGEGMKTAETNLETLKKTIEEGFMEVFRGFIPVGSVEFVSTYLRAYFPEAEKALRPLNIPECLFPFAGRKVVNVHVSDDYAPMEGVEDVYVKSMDEIDDWFNGPKYNVPENYEWKTFQHSQVSEFIEILSKWRVIVFHDKIRHIAPFSGDCTLFPSADAIKRMVETYKGQSPAAYVLDVAVTAKGMTVIVECRRFFSCRLYGYEDCLYLPSMFSESWKEMTNTK